MDFENLFWDQKWEAVRSETEPLTAGSIILVREFEILPGQDQRDPTRFRPERYAIIEGDFDFTIAFESTIAVENGKALPLEIDEQGCVEREIAKIGSMVVRWPRNLSSGTGEGKFRDQSHQDVCLRFFGAAMLRLPSIKTIRYESLESNGSKFTGNKVRYSEDLLNKLKSGKLCE
ncbi:MAG: hypothetical protein AAFP78_00145 [Pseudomonadota bacterium]